MSEPNKRANHPEPLSTPPPGCLFGPVLLTLQLQRNVSSDPAVHAQARISHPYRSYITTYIPNSHSRLGRGGVSASPVQNRGVWTPAISIAAQRYDTMAFPAAPIARVPGAAPTRLWWVHIAKEKSSAGGYKGVGGTRCGCSALIDNTRAGLRSATCTCVPRAAGLARRCCWQVAGRHPAAPLRWHRPDKMQLIDSTATLLEERGDARGAGRGARRGRRYKGC